jgi:drug/metabolite transporter (DMT)-like permease
MRPVPPLFLLHLVIAAWAFTAILGKLITLPPIDMVVWRTAIAALCFAGLAAVLRAPLRATRRDAMALLGVGALLGLHWVLFFLSARLATASVSLAALPTIVIWSSLLEPLANRSYRWSRLELAVGLVVVGAVWMIYGFEPQHWLGFTVGILSALAAALYAVVNKQIVGGFHFATLCTWQVGGACGTAWLLLPIVSGSAMPEIPGARDLGWLLVFAVGCTVLPYAGFVFVLRKLPIFTINIVYNLEPLYGIALATLILGNREHMTPGFYLGAAVLVAAVVAVPWIQRKAAR